MLTKQIMSDMVRLRDNIFQRLLRCQTFLPFGLELIKKEIIFADKIPLDAPAATDHLRIFVNPLHQFFSSQHFQRFSFALCHEIAHIMFMHNRRRGTRDIDLWRYACDFMINLFLYKLDLENREWESQQQLITFDIDKYSDTICFDLVFENMVEEEIYEFLQKNGSFSKEQIDVPYKKFLDDNGIPSDGVPEDVKIKATKSVLKFNGKLFKQINVEFPATTEQLEAKESEGAMLSKTLLENTILSKGFQSLDFERFLKKLFGIKVPWQDILKDSILTNLQKSCETCWSTPRLSWLCNPSLPYLPNVVEEEKYGTVAFLIDESGSVYDEDISKAADIVRQAKEFYKNILVIKHDTVVKWSKLYDEMTEECENEILTRRASGGTSHRDAFSKVIDFCKGSEDFISMVLSVTDLESDIETTQEVLPLTIPRIYLTGNKNRYNERIIGRVITI